MSKNTNKMSKKINKKHKIDSIKNAGYNVLKYGIGYPLWYFHKLYDDYDKWYYSKHEIKLREKAFKEMLKKVEDEIAYIIKNSNEHEFDIINAHDDDYLYGIFMGDILWDFKNKSISKLWKYYSIDKDFYFHKIYSKLLTYEDLDVAMTEVDDKRGNKYEAIRVKF